MSNESKSVFVKIMEMIASAPARSSVPTQKKREPLILEIIALVSSVPELADLGNKILVRLQRVAQEAHSFYDELKMLILLRQLESLMIAAKSAEDAGDLELKMQVLSAAKDHFYDLVPHDPEEVPKPEPDPDKTPQWQLSGPNQDPVPTREE